MLRLTKGFGWRFVLVQVLFIVLVSCSEEPVKTIDVELPPTKSLGDKVGQKEMHFFAFFVNDSITTVFFEGADRLFKSNQQLEDFLKENLKFLRHEKIVLQFSKNMEQAKRVEIIDVFSKSEINIKNLVLIVD